MNHIAKYKYMYGGMFSIPMLIRAVVGRSWGQGPQHSQSLQALLSHIPGLTIIMPSHASTLMASYAYAVKKWKGPVVSIEHRFLYDNTFKPEPMPDPDESPYKMRLVQSGKDLGSIPFGDFSRNLSSLFIRCYQYYITTNHRQTDYALLIESS